MPTTVDLGRFYGVFAGIGGFELGLRQAGLTPTGMCEIWKPARTVLRRRHPKVPLDRDARTVPHVRGAAGIVAGFPCNDLSQAGSMAGIEGENSTLVDEVFRLADDDGVRWVLLENVPNMLVLHGGAAIRHVTSQLAGLGFSWAYRVVDSRFTGVPQRRRRVLVFASREAALDPRSVLLGQDAGAPHERRYRDDAYGFYWTEGRWGIGWVADGMPTLKGGSTIGLPSAPAVWLPDAPPGRRAVMPGIGDGERLQGFYAGRTSPAANGNGRDHRWKLVGNAVTVGVARWVGKQIMDPKPVPPLEGDAIEKDTGWPDAGWGHGDEAFAAPVSEWPEVSQYRHLRDFLTMEETIPLSERATRGFLSRVEESSLHVKDEFVDDLEDHADFMQRHD